MARLTPAPNKWTPTGSQTASKMADERQPLLRSRTEERAILTGPPAHEVTTSAQDHTDYPIDHGSVAWMQVLGGFILFANSWLGGDCD